jgi:hypothetical protein
VAPPPAFRQPPGASEPSPIALRQRPLIATAQEDLLRPRAEQPGRRRVGD